MNKNLFGKMSKPRIATLCIGAMLLMLVLSGCGGAQPAPSASVLEGFSSAYLAGSETQNGEMVTLQLRSLYTSDAALEYAWYIYEADHMEEPIYKTGYLEEAEHFVELPTSQTGYRAYAYVRDKATGERAKAEVGYWQTENADGGYANVSEFTRLNVIVEETDTGRYRLTSHFNGGPQVQIYWAVYNTEDKNKTIAGQNYSYNNVFEYTLPEGEQRYAVKAFVRNVVTQEQKAAWVAYLPLEKLPEPPPDPIPGFTYKSIERTLLEDGYSFTNAFHGQGGAKKSFSIYKRSGAELTLLDTVEGDTLVFRKEDPDLDYVLKAYVCMEGGEEKTVEFYRLYGRPSQELLASGVPSITAPLDSLMNGQYKDYDISLPLNWLLPEINDRAERSMITTFRFGYKIITAYLATGNEAYAFRFLEYMQSWLNQYPDVPVEEDSELWNDYGVSFRTRIFSIARILFDHWISNDLLSQMENHLAQCADLLSSEFYYKYKHNHGMFQDYGLLLYLDAFGYTDRLEMYRRALAQERLEEYIEFSVLDSGCHTEHSPDYHSDIMRNIKWLADYYTWHEDSRAVQYREIVEKMKHFFFDLIMPDYTLPTLGDSYQTVVPQKWLEDDLRYKWVMTKGKEGKPPESTFAVYEDGGYAIMRSSWQDAPDEATYAILTAATHSTAHKHQDDLNFVLYHKGQLFTEAGKRNYNYDAPETSYAYSSFGHNVLFVNRQGWPMTETHHPVLDEAAYQTCLTGYGEEKGVMWASARSVRWPQVTQDRTLRYDRNTDYAEISDVLTAVEETDTRLIYHIAEGVEIEQTETGWLLSRGGVQVAEVRVAASEAATLSTLRGHEEDGDFKTWLFDSEHIETPMYGGLLIVDMRCKQGENSVSLQIELK